MAILVPKITIWWWWLYHHLHPNPIKWSFYTGHMRARYVMYFMKNLCLWLSRAFHSRRNSFIDGFVQDCSISIAMHWAVDLYNVISWDFAQPEIENRVPSQLKMPSCQYTDPHYKDKMVSWPSYLYNGNPYTWKDCLYIEMGSRLTLYCSHLCAWYYIMLYWMAFCGIPLYRLNCATTDSLQEN